MVSVLFPVSENFNLKRLPIYDPVTVKVLVVQLHEAKAKVTLTVPNIVESTESIAVTIRGPFPPEGPNWANREPESGPLVQVFPPNVVTELAVPTPVAVQFVVIGLV